MTLPTQPDFDWGSLTVHAVERLRAPKVPPVPEAIVRLAQQSYEGVTDPRDPAGPKLHVLRHTFDEEERAAKFAGHLRNAGKWTMPKTTTMIVVDPDNLRTAEGRADWREVNPGIDISDEDLISLGGRTVAWRTGAHRRRRTKEEIEAEKAAAE